MVSILFYISFGVISVVLFYEDVYLPIAVSATIMTVVALHLFWLFQQSRVGMLTLLIYAVYALPFIHIFPYIWFDFSAPPPKNLWGLAVNPYSTNKLIIELMSMLGAVGAAGYILGAQFVKGKLASSLLTERIAQYRTSINLFTMPTFFLWVAIAVLLTWVSAPKDTLFDAVYTNSEAISHNWNFASAWMVSYAFIVFALADAMFEVSPSRGKIKRKIVLISLLLIVVWFQLLRGDRESLTLVLAVICMYNVWGKDIIGQRKSRTKPNWLLIMSFTFMVLVASYMIGITRQSMTNVDNISSLITVISELVNTGEIRVDNMLSGTWSAVLLTPLSVAGDYINGTLSLKYGETYIDLLGSMLPGFVADWIGYTRPINGNQGPAWEMTYGIGGTHAIVVPFMNFRIIGVFLVMGLWGYIFTKIERHALKKMTVSNLALLGMIALCLPHWLWYGEKAIMNIIIVWVALSFIYRLRIATRSGNYSLLVVNN